MYLIPTPIKEAPISTIINSTIEISLSCSCRTHRWLDELLINHLSARSESWWLKVPIGEMSAGEDGCDRTINVRPIDSVHSNSQQNSIEKRKRFKGSQARVILVMSCSPNREIDHETPCGSKGIAIYARSPHPIGHWIEDQLTIRQKHPLQLDTWMVKTNEWMNESFRTTEEEIILWRHLPTFPWVENSGRFNTV